MTDRLNPLSPWGAWSLHLKKIHTSTCTHVQFTRYGTEWSNHLPKPYRAKTSCCGWFINLCLAQSTGPLSWPMDTRKVLALSFNTPALNFCSSLLQSWKQLFVSLIAEQVVIPIFFWVSVLIFHSTLWLSFNILGALFAKQKRHYYPNHKIVWVKWNICKCISRLLSTMQIWLMSPPPNL